MKQRIITGIFIAAAYIATILGTVLWNPVVFDVFAVFIMFAAGYEVLRCTEAKFAPTVKGFYMVAVALEYIAYKAVMHYLGLYYALAAVMLLTVIFAVIVLNFTMFSKKYEVKGGAATAFVLFYPALPLFIMLRQKSCFGGGNHGVFEYFACRYDGIFCGVRAERAQILSRDQSQKDRSRRRRRHCGRIVRRTRDVRRRQFFDWRNDHDVRFAVG